jgi:hypothetical protein
MHLVVMMRSACMPQHSQQVSSHFSSFLLRMASRSICGVQSVVSLPTSTTPSWVGFDIVPLYNRCNVTDPLTCWHWCGMRGSASYIKMRRI